MYALYASNIPKQHLSVLNIFNESFDTCWSLPVVSYTFSSLYDILVLTNTRKLGALLGKQCVCTAFVSPKTAMKSSNSTCLLAAPSSLAAMIFLKLKRNTVVNLSSHSFVESPWLAIHVLKVTPGGIVTSKSIWGIRRYILRILENSSYKSKNRVKYFCFRSKAVFVMS